MYRQNPLHSFHERLTDLRAARERRVWLRSQLDGAVAAEARVHERIDAAAARLEREQRDVRRMESTTLLSLFYELFGRREHKLAAERAEAAAAALVLEECREELRALRVDLASMQTRYGELDGVDEAYATTRAEAIAWATSTGNEEQLELLGLAEQRGARSEWLREVDEAVDAGRRASKALGELAARIGAIDEAVAERDVELLESLPRDQLRALLERIASTQRVLASFADELDDARLHPDGAELRAVDRSMGVAFGVIFFDDLVKGWLERDHASRAREQVLTVRKGVDAAVVQLDAISRRGLA